MISSTVFVCEEKIMSTTTSRNNSLIRLNKVPQIVLTFWIIKILSTTVGETVADYLAVNLGLGLGKTCAFMLAVLCVTLCIQIKSKSYTYWIYWLYKVFTLFSMMVMCEPTRVFRRQFILSHATLADSSNWR